MNFLSPLFLLGALAVAGPILYHLVRRQTRARVRFSSLLFLTPSAPRIAQRRRVEDLLLLLLRCLAVGLLALGFARPFLREPPPADPAVTPGRRVVLLVDTSASLRRTGLWDESRRRAERVLRTAGPGDEVAILAFADAVTPLLSAEEWTRTAPGDRVALGLARLATVSPGWGGTQLGRALVAAAESLAEGGRRPGASGEVAREVVLVGDLQAGSRLDALQAYEWPRGVRLVVEGVKAGPGTNAALQLVAEAPEATAATAAATRVRVTNAPDSKREQFQVGWSRGGSFVGAPIDAYVPPGQARVLALPAPPDGAVEIVLRGDDEDFDNHVHVLPPVARQSGVLWLGSDGGTDPRAPFAFLRRAFYDTPRLAVKVAARAPAVAGELGDAALVLVAAPLPPEAEAAVRRRVEAGGVAVILPGGASAAAGLLGVSLPAGNEVRPGGYAMLGAIDFRHPLFAPFADPRFSDFTKIRFWRYWRWDEASVPGAVVAARFDGGDPAVVDVPVGRGRVFLFAAGWHPDESQLAMSSKFVPLLWSWLELGGGRASAPAQHVVGESVPLPAGTVVQSPVGGPVVTVGADGAFVARAPGVQVATLPDGEVRRLACNLDPNEGRTAPLGLDELEQLGLPLAAVPAAGSPAPKGADPRLPAAEAEGRQKLWRWFLGAALLVLLLESLLAGRAARRPAAVEVSS